MMKRLGATRPLGVPEPGRPSHSGFQGGDDEKHADRHGGRLGKDEPELAHGFERAALRRRSWMLVRGGSLTRYARRNPDSLVLDYCAKRLDAPLRVPLLACACVRARAIRVFTIRINKLDGKIWCGARLSV